MTTLSIIDVSRSGDLVAGTAAAAGGDQFLNTGSEFIIISNNSGGQITLTIETPNSIDTDLAIADRTVTLEDTEQKVVGPFQKSNYNDSDGYVQLTYSGVSSVTVDVFRLTRV